MEDTREVTEAKVKEQLPATVLREVARQEYGGNRCIFSAGIVEGREPDTIYLKIEKDEGEPATTIFLRADEAMCIIWLLAGALWSENLSTSE